MTRESPDALMATYASVLDSQDWNLVEDLLHDEAVVLFTEGTYRGKEAIRAAFERTFALIREEVFRIEDLHWVARTADMACCEYVFRWSGIIAGQPASGAGRGSSVVLRSARGWQIVQEHLGPLPRSS
ncbi:MAG: nuclear transport factor 2 family protein [Myxococcota bacterium]